MDDLKYYKHTYINSIGVKIFKVSNKPWATYSKNKNYLKFINSEVIEEQKKINKIEAIKNALGTQNNR